ncbi:hypothetical protein PV325_013927 [Microctonus aethiopoides]|uniref:Uncharacterized protein n=1 Tax=Microctonus aethiopoides TaxID=144406 RepID=A0AA39C601_9HYME|nr:hypothetical protein PV326_013608 [Microctonus aethiopoides]KAK0087837.1 hypothetical protein PV325_013927 [Microctonus aethiopoides]KAK0158511.1 hypothetical protein PV328_009507 [Microctonus aethiopoides]
MAEQNSGVIVSPVSFRQVIYNNSTVLDKPATKSPCETESTNENLKLRSPAYWKKRPEYWKKEPEYWKKALYQRYFHQIKNNNHSALTKIN